MLLRDWLIQNDVRLEDCANRLNIGVRQVYRWVAGTAKPTLRNVYKIAKITNGAVTADDWRDADE